MKRMLPLYKSAGLVFLVVLLCCCIFPLDSSAEFYLGGEAGVVFPQNFSDVKGTGLASSTPRTGIELKNTLLYGGRVGYFLPALKWLGLETEAFNSTPDIKQHSYILQTSGGTGTLTRGLHMRVTAWAFNLVLRDPGRIIDEHIEPYLAIGPALYFAETSTGSRSSSDTAVGFNLALGARWFMTSTLAFFAEYKFNSATFQFDNALAPGAGLRGDYMAQNLVGGLTVHFGRGE